MSIELIEKKYKKLGNILKSCLESIENFKKKK